MSISSVDVLRVEHLSYDRAKEIFASGVSPMMIINNKEFGGVLEEFRRGYNYEVIGGALDCPVSIFDKVKDETLFWVSKMNYFIFYSEGNWYRCSNFYELHSNLFNTVIGLLYHECDLSVIQIVNIAKL